MVTAFGLVVIAVVSAALSYLVSGWIWRVVDRAQVAPAPRCARRHGPIAGRMRPAVAAPGGRAG